MLDWEPSDMEEKPSDEDKGGVSPPELDVHVLDRERVAGPGREKTGIAWTKERRSASIPISFPLELT